MSEDHRQQEIRHWFDKTYRKRGLGYLRPIEAYAIFLDLMKVRKGQHILDVACGPGLLLELARQRGLDVAGIDLSPVAVNMAKERIPSGEIMTANAEELPFADGSFDFITCIGSLERFLNLGQALGEQYRVGTSEATYCYMVRNSERYSWKLVKDILGIRNRKGHQGARSLEQWQQTFAQAGFVLESVYPDPWPKMRWRQWFARRTTKIDLPPTVSKKKLRTAYEFIFLLKKAGR